MKYETRPFGDPDFIHVLDHGFVRGVDHMGGDISIIRAARNSFDAAWRAGESEEKDDKLMRRLWRGKSETDATYRVSPLSDQMAVEPLPPLPKHSTPFEAVTVTFEIHAPIFVFRQWHRHRTQSYNELSARYKQLPSEYYLPEPVVVGFQDPKNKQGRVLDMTMEQVEQRREEIEQLDAHCARGYNLYLELIQKGWPLELARLSLGFGMYSNMFCTMNLLNFFKFANLRADPHAQMEIRVFAEKMVWMVGAICPVATALFLEANPESTAAPHEF